MKKCTLDAHTNEFCNREFKIEQFTLAGSSTTLNTVVLLGTGLQSEPITRMRKTYRFYSYDSIDVRITPSDPKSTLGYWTAHILPYSVNTAGGNYLAFVSNTDYAWSLCEHSKAQSLSAPGDMTFNFPWSYRSPLMLTNYTVPTLMGQPRPGTPIMNVAVRAAQYLSGPSSTHFSVYVKYNGLKFYAPMYTAEAQSGIGRNLDPHMMGLGATIMGMPFAKTFMDDFSSTGLGELFSDEPKQGSDYQSPKDFTPVYMGDTTSCLPYVGASLRSKQKKKKLKREVDSMHQLATMDDVSVNSFLSRSQWLLDSNNLNQVTLSNNIPTFEIGNPTSVLRKYTWFNYFRQLARFWSGDIIFDIMVHSHPTVECKLEVSTAFLAIGGTVSFGTDKQNYSNLRTEEFVFQGPKTYSINVPLASILEYIQITGPPAVWQSTQVKFNLRVLSHLWPDPPVIPYSIFVRAAPNFRFYDPISPSSKASFLSAQAGLHPEPAEHFTNSALRRGSVLIPLESFKQIMSIWSGYIVDDVNTSSFPYYPVKRPSFGPIGAYDFIGFLMQLYMYRRGSIHNKVLCGRRITGDQRRYVGVSLSYPGQTPILDVPIAGATSITTSWYYPPWLDLSKGTAVTDPALQPLLEFCIDRRGPNSMGYTSSADDELGFAGVDPEVDTNIELIHVSSGVAEFPDKLFRKVAHDFSFVLERAPPDSMFSQNI